MDLAWCGVLRLNVRSLYFFGFSVACLHLDGVRKKITRKWDHPKINTTCETDLQPNAKKSVYRKTKSRPMLKTSCTSATEHTFHANAGLSFRLTQTNGTIYLGDVVSIKHKPLSRLPLVAGLLERTKRVWTGMPLISLGKNKLCQHESGVGIMRWFIYESGSIFFSLLCFTLGKMFKCRGHNYRVHFAV